jgi:hypothetical protein
MIKTLMELFKAPKDIHSLCKELECQAQETVASIKRNGVILDELKKKSKTILE